MSKYLLAISIGPVQGFIAAARRTRDFWMGSAILSEVAKAVAKAVVQPAGLADPKLDRLIFPAPLRSDDLAPLQFDSETRELQSEFGVTNVILCLVESTPENIKKEVGRLREVAQERWREIARRATQHCTTELRPEWEEQLKDELIEFYAAWVPYTDAAQYAHDRQRVMRFLSGRKACRDFEPWQGVAGLPKSSLDAARETILTAPGQGPSRRQGLRIKPGEQLDLAGVMKRAEWEHDSIRYPSLSRVAVDPWIRGIIEAGATDPAIRTQFNDVLKTCRELVQLGVLLQRRSTNPEGVENDLAKFPWLRSFPFEGTPLYVNRHQELLDDLTKEAVCSRDKAKSANGMEEALKELQGSLNELCKTARFKAPWEYAAMLAADGDRMGATLAHIARLPGGLAKHREFSRRQSQFAGEVREIVNKQFHGACFYAGADDVLAMVAVDQAIDCARHLHDRFGQLLGKLVQSWGLAPPTLSVGIAIGHFLEPLEDLLSYVREAEKRAKTPTVVERARGQTERNGLAISVHSRGGAPFTVRGNWGKTPDQSCIAARVMSWAALHRQRLLAAKAPYDLRRLAAEYAQTWRDLDALAAAIRSEAVRLLRRKQGHSGVSPEHTKQLIERLLTIVATPNDLLEAAHELMLGQWIGDAMDQAEGVSHARRASVPVPATGEST